MLSLKTWVIHFYKLPTRQLTCAAVAGEKDKFYKLPTRQLTLVGADVWPGTIYKLPTRQLTTDF